jgi:RNA polymerase sigma-70 factor, ECF subfamily
VLPDGAAFGRVRVLFRAVRLKFDGQRANNNGSGGKCSLLPSDSPTREAVSAQEQLTSIHQRLLAEEPTAPQELVNTCVARLYAILKRHFAFVPREEVQDAVHDALLALIVRPELYEPARGSLVNIGRNKLVDQVRKFKRRGAEIAMDGTVELAELEAKYLHEHGYAGIEPEPMPAEVEALLSEILPESRDRQVWDLVCEGRTPVEAFAAVLGLGHLPPEEMKTAVKRHRDRVIKKVQRRREEFRRYLL